jgi:hypothetical protein
MRKLFSLLFAGTVVLLMVPLASLAQEEEEPETRIMTITTMTVPFGEDFGTFLDLVDTYFMPQIQANPYVLSYRIGTHYWGQTRPNIWIVTEYASLGDIEASEDWGEAWFEEHYPEGTPEAEAAEEAYNKVFWPVFSKHTDQILNVDMSRVK